MHTVAALTSLAYTADLPARPSARPIAHWLLFCAGMVFAMAVIGAITRLTESGLSMVEWKPLIGVLPPMTAAEWERVFALYRETPEYRIMNSGMSLDAFKTIFFWEWFHRLWGHLIGAAFLFPFLWFWVRGRIPRSLMPKLVGLFLLGGLQGVIGWFMVLSGLADAPDVSHYRLALHLGTALVIYALLVAVALGLLDPAPLAGWRPEAVRLRRHAGWALGLVAVTVVWGAFVAGINAGFAYNSFPLMNGHWIPPEVATLTPWWLNAFENTAAVQFIHRVLAIGTGVVVLALWARVRAARLPGNATGVADGLAVAILVQIALGVTTLLTVVWIPVAAAHQAGALVVITMLVWLRHTLKPIGRPAAMQRA